ncbi:uncharacterized protein LOC113506659 isoform X2 [Trichoplusia ni]|uniref:Uncharacterized protein LOC113506659 isoform X2 n=1 Tax=Trichoplusia ni TaxID=7111 RepID=A0A7E5WYN0_TRINI|nr:uncharacterized protein LOC113506659 isoform X2 [Trichoplusia ni]
MNVAKRMMIHPQSGYEVSVTALFILDGLLKQELFVGIIGLKLFQHELPAVKRLERIAREQRRADVLDVLRALLLQGPVSFYYTHELGLSMPVDAAMNSPYKYAIMANDQLSALVEIHKLREEYSDIGGAAAHLEESFAQRLTACLKIVKPVKSAKRARLASDPQDKSGPSGSSAEPKAGGSKQPKKRKAMESQEQAQPVGLAQRDEPIPSGSGINKGKGKSSANSAPPGEGNASNKRKRISHFDCTCDSDGEDHECQSTSAGNAGDSYGDDLDLSLFTKEMPRAGPSGSSQAGGAAEAKSTGDSADTADSTDSDSTDDDEGIDFNAEDDEIPVIEVVPKADRLAMQGRKVERRYLKQTILKSRLRRMGILEVAFGIPEEE